MLMTGRELLKLALPHQGEKYMLGAIAPKDQADYDGPWDCAEFASWLVYQLTSRLYGCANNNGNPGGADAFSGFWARDANKIGEKISVDQAAKIPGAVVLRLSGPDLIGHVVISNGSGGTVEAHSTKAGVIASTLHGRRWDCGVLVPWITYDVLDAQHPPIKKPGTVYRWMVPMMQGDKVKEIQRALSIRPDGFYGPKTANAVRAFQRNQNLVADGEVGALTAARLGILL